LSTITNRNLKPAETFGPIITVGEGIAALSKLSYETMLSMRDMPALPPAIVMDVYKIACLARSIDETVGATKALES